MKRIFFFVFDAIFRFNIRYRLTLPVEVMITGFQTGIYFAVVLYFLLQGIINIRTGDQSNHHLAISFLIFVISTAKGLLMSFDEKNIYNSRKKRKDKAFQKKDWILIFAILLAFSFYQYSKMYI